MDLQVARCGCGCGSYWLGRCGVERNLWLQLWYLICSYVGGSILSGFVSLTCFLTQFTSPYTLNAQRGWHNSEPLCYQEFSISFIKQNICCLFEASVSVRLNKIGYFQLLMCVLSLENLLPHTSFTVSLVSQLNIIFTGNLKTSPSDVRNLYSTRPSAFWYPCHIASNIGVTLQMMVWKGFGTQRRYPILFNVQIIGLDRKNYKITLV